MDVRKSRSSIEQCEERYACKVDGDYLPVATFFCSSCKAKLCVDCDRVVHERSNCRNHDRVHLETPSEVKLCAYARSECKKRNFADVRCQQCDASLCYDCDARVHRTERKHIRRSFDKYYESLKAAEQLAPLNQSKPHDNQLAGASPPSASQPVSVQPKASANDSRAPFANQKASDASSSSQVHRALNDAFRPERVQPSSVASAYIVNANAPIESFSEEEYHSLEPYDMAHQAAANAQPATVANTNWQPTAITSVVQQQVGNTPVQLTTQSGMAHRAQPKSSETGHAASSRNADGAQMNVAAHGIVSRLEDALDDELGTSSPRHMKSATGRNNASPSSPVGNLNSRMTEVNLNVEPASRSVQLLDAKESFQLSDSDTFCEELGFGCTPLTPVKVVSIVGNTGDGKSHTLNRTFFKETPMFAESNEQKSCTAGVCAALCPASASWLNLGRSNSASHAEAMVESEPQQFGILVLDTEGLLGCDNNQLQRNRMLLKVMAVSDVIIYRTRAERLHVDTFAFLADAGRSYSQHFVRELDRVRAAMCAASAPASGTSKQPATGATVSRPSSSSETKQAIVDLHELGPILVVFHETLHTEPLANTDEFRKCFQEVGRKIEDLAGFSTLEYLGVRSGPRIPASFAQQVGVGYDAMNIDQAISNQTLVPIERLAATLRKHVANDTVRKPRSLDQVWRMLEAVNNKFDNQINSGEPPCVFPDTYFSCTVRCQACNARCILSLNHERDSNTLHCAAKSDCCYVHSLSNRVLLCKKCHNNGIRNELVPQLATREDGVLTSVFKYALAGYTLECQKCGVVFREREYWFNNPDPINSSSVHSEIVHSWLPCAGISGPNVGRAIVDQVQSASKAIGSYTYGPAQRVTNYLPSLYAPSYWVPNEEIFNCVVCDVRFTENDSKHHCRKCGKGVCAECSKQRICVPERGWNEPVRVCDRCFRESSPNGEPANATNDVGHEQAANAANGPQTDTTLRRFGETLELTLRGAQQTIVRTVQESVRPSYWRPDLECHACIVCKKNFGPKLALHHCRKCGEPVCHDCSPELREVPERGWTYKVRVCNNCLHGKQQN